MAEKRLKYTAEQIDSAIEKVKNMPSEGIVGPQGPRGETGATGAAGAGTDPAVPGRCTGA